MTVDLNLEHQAPLPKKKDYAIGAIGAGFIMRDCHLVAYGHAGYKVVAIAAPRPAQTREVAGLRGIPKVYDTYQDLFAQGRPLNATSESAPTPLNRVALSDQRNLSASAHTLCDITGEGHMILARFENGRFPLRVQFRDQLPLGAVKLAVSRRVELEVRPALNFGWENEGPAADHHGRMVELRLHEG